MTAEELARRFHEAYERLAPSFGYETRPDTRLWDAWSQNGKLMIAVCEELFPPALLSSNTNAVLERLRQTKERQQAQHATPRERPCACDLCISINEIERLQREHDLTYENGKADGFLEREELRAENERLLALLDNIDVAHCKIHGRRWQDSCHGCSEAQRLCDETADDAERYRWLRQRAIGVETDPDAVGLVFSIPLPEEMSLELAPHFVDSVIDAARGTEKTADRHRDPVCSACKAENTRGQVLENGLCSVCEFL